MACFVGKKSPWKTYQIKTHWFKKSIELSDWFKKSIEFSDQLKKSIEFFEQFKIDWIVQSIWQSIKISIQLNIPIDQIFQLIRISYLF